VNGDSNSNGLPGQVQRQEDTNGNTVNSVYDVFGRLLRQWQPYDRYEMPTVSYQYLDWYNGPTTAVRTIEWELPGVSGANRPTVTFYDGLGRVVQTKVESANVSEMVITHQTYDELGRPRYQYVPYKESSSTYFYDYRPENTAQPKTSYTYDALDRALTVTQPDGKVTTTAYKICYNASDNDFKFPRLCEEVTDANNHKVRYASDAFGRLRSVTQWNGATEVRARYEYDEFDQLLSAEDPGAAKATMTYDKLGRKLTMSDADMGAWQYRYDPLNNLVAQRDAKNQATCLLYDAFSRLIGKNYTAGISDINAFTCPNRRDVAYNYDSGTNGKGQRTGMWNAASSEAWSYDQCGRLIGETKTITGTGTFVSSWSYDSMNRLTWQKYPGVNGGQAGEQVNYTYRNVGLLQTVAGTNTYVGETQYDALGHVTLRNLGSASGVLGQRYTYPSTKNYRLGTLTSGVASSFNNLQNITYTYDNVGNVLTIGDTAANGGSQTQTFTYDALDRLATAVASGGWGAYAQQSYGYTAHGNLTRFNSATDNLAYNDAAHKHAVTHVGGTQKYWYDANGNATKRIGEDGASYEFGYDFENRVTQLKKNGAVISAFKYDGDSNRILETTGGVTTAYLGNTYE
jgi:YD repeat-containing protein